MLAQQGERRLLLGGGREQLEEIPLGNQRNVLVRTRDSTQVDVHLGALDLHGQRFDLAVRQPGELAAKTQLVEQPQRAGMHGVAAKVAKEVGVLLHHRDGDAGPGQQQAEHDARGPAACDDAGGGLRIGRHAAIFADSE